MMKTSFVALLGLALAQARPSFEVLSVKPMTSNSPGMSMQTNPGRFFTRGSNLKFLIQYAYRMKSFQISGGPDWMNTDRFEIEGKFNAGENKDNDDKLLLMLQSALEDRFKLKFHRETKDAPVFELTVAKNGPKLTPASNEPIPTGGNRGGGFATLTSTRTLRSRGATMANFAAFLSDSLGRAVIDKTGLDGKFDITLEYSDDTAPVAAGEPSTRAASLFTALQEQLGLKLETGRGPVELFVVDSAQKPSGN
jgi:uncharacterized protein (TIGR03435 family)